MTNLEINVQIANNEEQAFLTVFSGEENTSKELTVDELKKSLSEKGVIEGIKENVLDQICQHKNFNHKFLVAEAIPPQTGENATIQIKIKPKERPTYEKGVDAERRVNHYGVKEGFITYVKEGEILGTRIPPKRGANGFTVTGNKIDGILGRDISWLDFQGKDTKVVDNDLIAVNDGILKKEGLKLSIEQYIKLEGDLGIKTGSIILPLEADIEMFIPGDIKGGFSVQCRKITVMGNIEDARIRAKILEVKRGIVGTSDMPIVVDYLTTGFIMGTRKIKSKFINVKKEISGGSKIQADFVRSHVIQKCTVIAKYGVWTDHLYGSNNIWVGIDVDKNEEYNNWSRQLEGVEKALKEMESSNQNLLKKADSVREMAKRMPNNPLIKKELAKINEIMDKMSKIEKVQETLKQNLQLHRDKMYVSGSPFILVGLGFTKKELVKDKDKPINKFTIKESSYGRGKPTITGLYTLKGDEVVADSKYNVSEIREIMENYEKASLN